MTSAEVEQGAAVLARALREDPFQAHLLADRAGEAGVALPFFEASVNLGLLYGEVYTTEAVEGVAVWIAPEHADLTLAQLYRSRFFGGGLSMGVRAFVRLLRTAVFVDRVKKSEISERHWTLYLLCVDPRRHGRGTGSRLLRPILDRADAEGVHCYLESTSERNLSFYRRHGFEVVRQETIPLGGPPIRMLIREPR